MEIYRNLLTVLFSALTNSAHFRRVSGGSFFSMMLTELVVVISASKPNRLRSL